MTFQKKDPVKDSQACSHRKRVIRKSFDRENTK